jgi:hypothetical protein
MSTLSQLLSRCTYIGILGIFLTIPFLSTVYAHPPGNSKAKITIHSDKIVAEIDVNSSDFLSIIVLNKPYWKLSPADQDTAEKQLEYYLDNHLIFEVDGNTLQGMKVEKWFEDAKTPDERMDSAAFKQKTYIMTLVWDLPENAGELEFQSNIFVEHQLEILCTIEAFWENRALGIYYLEIDDILSLNLHPDSLNKLAKKAAGPPPESKPQMKIYVLSIAIFFIVIIGFIVFFRKKRR